MIPTDARILVIAPHADDETISLGASLSLWSGRARVALVSGGPYTSPVTGEVDERQKNAEFQAAMHALGIVNWSVLGYPESRLDTVPMVDLVTTLDDEISAHDPGVILSPLPSHHQDHRTVSLAVRASLRRAERGDVMMHAEYGYGRVNLLDVTASPVYLPVDDGAIDRKGEALRCYTSQVRARSIDPEEVISYTEVLGRRIGAAGAEVVHLRWGVAAP